VQDGRIVELLGAGQSPSRPCEQVFDASQHVCCPA
jgi:8-oxoguanine deaminase